jgi:iron complex transport system substrate-binding protein
VLWPLLGGMLGACVAQGDARSATERADRSHTMVAERIAADTDDFGVPLPTDARFAARVVSLNPAATEAIFALGQQARLVGRSRWDQYPDGVESIPSLGDGIRPAIEPVLAARPTLVILYATSENRAAADALARAGVRVLALRVDRIAHFHAQMHALGRALGAEAQARAVSDSVQRTLDAVRVLTAGPAELPTVVWPVWGSPPMVIGGGSYMNELLDIAGARNVFGDSPQPSPSVSIEEIVRRAPQFVVTSGKRAGELQEDPVWRALPAVRDRRFILEDPAITGRPGPVMGMAAVQLARALHPTLAGALDSLSAGSR